MQKTQLGWILGGEIIEKPRPRPAACHLAIASTLQDQLERFWSQGEIEEESIMTQEEEMCEK